MQLLALFFLIAAPASAVSSTAESGVNPISRVVELLQGLANKIEEDGKAEEALYEKYECWYKSVKSQKEASNAAAEERIQYLEGYIDDLSSGKIELTTERADLEKQRDEIQEWLDTNAKTRAKEEEDFAAAKEEMETAIAALKEAITVLEEGTKGGSAFLSAAFDIKKVLSLGKAGGLSEKDTRFLERALEMDEAAPSMDGKDKDWKKLNRKATFKMKYKARSGKITQLLKDMQATFEDNLKEATEKEEEAKANYEKLKGSKEEELDATEQALIDMNKEGDARKKEILQAEEERDDLKEQVENDTKYLEETQTAMDTKAEEWSERKKARAEEIAAIQEAIGILHSDDARDTFKSSFESQGYLLLQEESETECSPKRRQRRALRILRGVARRGAHGMRLSGIVSQLQTGGHFDKVLEAIDKQIQDLKDQNDADLEKKEDCEKTRMEETRKAKELSQKVDEEAGFIERKQALVESIKKEIKEAEDKIPALEEQKDEADKQREEEKMEFDSSKKDDEMAVQLIEKAIGVLSKIYQKAGAFVQRQPGEAPPPPPSADFSSGPAQGEGNGIIAILEMIKADVEKDMTAAETEEKEAVTAHEEFVASIEAEISELQTLIADQESAMADAMDAISDSETTKAGQKETLDSVMEGLKDMAPGCDFIAVHWETRKKNREIELDGLLQAKTVLKQHDEIEEAPAAGFLQHHRRRIPC